ncbi:MAG: ClpX C4-type zinc finger protein [Kofleriaceae bacterium]|nr:ClpX C4-type zinc finger protein [Kofleriaceae bacterium]
MNIIPDACSFCARDRAQVQWLVKGPAGVQICERCVVDGEAHGETDARRECSFCRAKPASYVSTSWYSTRSGICPACLALCRQIIAEAAPAALPTARVVPHKP